MIHTSKDQVIAVFDNERAIGLRIVPGGGFCIDTPHDMQWINGEELLEFRDTVNAFYDMIANTHPWNTEWAKETKTFEVNNDQPLERPDEQGMAVVPEIVEDLQPASAD